MFYRSHALRGNAAFTAPAVRYLRRWSVAGGIPTQARRAEPWTGSAECYGSVASIRRITSLYPPYNS